MVGEPNTNTAASQPTETWEKSRHPFAQVFVSGKYADAVLRVRNLVETTYVFDVPVHRVILASGSPYMDNLFSQPPEDQTTLHGVGKSRQPQICGVWSVAVHSDSAMHVFLQWMYFGTAIHTKESCWGVLALSRHMYVPDLEEHVGKWISDNLLARTLGEPRPTSEWYEYILGALHARVTQNVVDNLIEAAVIDDQILSPTPFGIPQTFHRYTILRNLVRAAEIKGTPLTSKQVRYMFKTIDYKKWPRDQLQQAYMDGLLPRDKICTALSTSEPNPSEFTSKVADITPTDLQVPTVSATNLPKPDIQQSHVLDHESDMQTIKPSTVKLARKSIINFHSDVKDLQKSTLPTEPAPDSIQKTVDNVASIDTVPSLLPGAYPNPTCNHSSKMDSVRADTELPSHSTRAIMNTFDEQKENAEFTGLNLNKSSLSVESASTYNQHTSPSNIEISNQVNTDSLAYSESLIRETPEQCLNDIRLQLDIMFANEPTISTDSYSSDISNQAVVPINGTLIKSPLVQKSVQRTWGSKILRNITANPLSFSTGFDSHTNASTSPIPLAIHDVRSLHPLTVLAAEVKALHNTVQNTLVSPHNSITKQKDGGLNATMHLVKTDPFGHGLSKPRDRSKTDPSDFVSNQANHNSAIGDSKHFLKKPHFTRALGENEHSVAKSDLSASIRQTEQILKKHGLMLEPRRLDIGNGNFKTWKDKESRMGVLSSTDTLVNEEDTETPTRAREVKAGQHTTGIVSPLNSRQLSSAYPFPLPPSINVGNNSTLRGISARQGRGALPNPPKPTDVQSEQSKRRSLNPTFLMESATDSLTMPHGLSNKQLDSNALFLPRRSMFGMKHPKQLQNDASSSRSKSVDVRFSLPPPEASSLFMDNSLDDIQAHESKRQDYQHNGTFKMLKLKHASFVPPGLPVPDSQVMPPKTLKEHMDDEANPSMSSDDSYQLAFPLSKSATMTKQPSQMDPPHRGLKKQWAKSTTFLKQDIRKKQSLMNMLKNFV
ncbi:hypothetical protein RTP6_002931 [Batrachochytrium dendrobatidis]